MRGCMLVCTGACVYLCVCVRACACAGVCSCVGGWVGVGVLARGGGAAVRTEDACGLASVKQVDNVNAKVALQPLHITVCAMQHLHPAPHAEREREIHAQLHTHAVQGPMLLYGALGMRVCGWVGGSVCLWVCLRVCPSVCGHVFMYHAYVYAGACARMCARAHTLVMRGLAKAGARAGRWLRSASASTRKSSVRVLICTRQTKP
jgi:hypothetical protein